MSIIKLPSMEHTFDLDVVGTETKRHFCGKFTYRRPSLHVRSNIEVMSARLSGDLATIPLTIKLFNEIYSVLFNCIVQAPEWWNECNKGRDLYDLNVLEELYNECMNFEDKWHKEVYGDEVVEEKKE